MLTHSGMLHAIDVSDPTTPRFSGSKTIVGTPTRLALRDGALWVAAHGGGVYGFDVAGD